MFSELALPLRIALTLLSAFAVSYFMVPSVKRFAESVGAIDMPNARRINKVPIPRMGGIAIFCGFMVSAILFVDLTDQVKGILIGSVISRNRNLIDIPPSFRRLHHNKPKPKPQ